MGLLVNSGMNNYTMKLEEDKQPLYGLIYSLSLEKWKTLQTYIEIYLKTGFIQFSKFPAKASILFDQKQDGSLHLYVDYRGFNKLTI